MRRGARCLICASPAVRELPRSGEGYEQNNDFGARHRVRVSLE
jgi:hypothetical protein